MDQNRRALSLRDGALVATAAVTALSAFGAQPPAAHAAAEPGQPVNDDYGQSAAEVSAEIAAQVAAERTVIAAKAATTAARKVLSTRIAAYSKAYAGYRYANKHHYRGLRLTRAVRALTAARAARAKAQTAYNAALARQKAVIAARTASIRALHYRPVDGVYAGDLTKYLVPSLPISFEPMQVQVTVYGGHVSDVTVIAQASPTSDSASYNTLSLTTLALEAMKADGSAAIAAVTGASLSSEAFTQSLQSALVAAGFHA